MTTPPRRRLLIVDDSPVALSFLSAVFRGASFEVETAADGGEAMEKALRALPDLVITDGLMPDVDGFELVRRLKANPITANIPIVMLTSGDITDAEYTARSPQPDAVVTKSMELEPLMKQVTALLASPSPQEMHKN